MLNLDYLTDSTGAPKAVIIPIALWRQIFPEFGTPLATEDFTDAIEDYCLHKAMTEATETPLLNREAALDYLFAN